MQVIKKKITKNIYARCRHPKINLRTKNIIVKVLHIANNIQEKATSVKLNILLFVLIFAFFYY